MKSTQLQQELQQDYWRKNLRLTGWLLLVWFVATFGVAYFARELAEWNFFGWPFSFYMAAQGSLLVYVGIVWWYARKMKQFDTVFNAGEPE